MKHLIIGAGAAALSALGAIRRVTAADEVRLVSREDCLPYSPAALPHLLADRITEADLWTQDEDYFKSLRATLVKGKEVTGILPEKKYVTYRDGSSESYDTLLIASGSEPVKPRIQGLPEKDIYDFKTLADCRCILSQLRPGINAAILGAGPTGMHMAAALMEKGCRVSIIEREPGVLPTCFNEEAEICIKEIFADRGTRFLTGKVVAGAERKSGKISIDLADGSTVNADILINATGVKGRVTFLEGIELNIRSGIVVDARMRTGIDGIYAAGDVAEGPDFFTGRPRVNAIILSAVDQGRVAGAGMVGQDAEYAGAIPMTAFNFFGNTAYSIGLPMSQGKVLKQTSHEKRQFKKLVFNGDRLIGAMLLNETVDPGIVYHLIKRRVDLGPHREALFEGTRPLSDPWLSSLKLPYEQGR